MVSELNGQLSSILPSLACWLFLSNQVACICSGPRNSSFLILSKILIDLLPAEAVSLIALFVFDSIYTAFCSARPGFKIYRSKKASVAVVYFIPTSS